MESNLYMIRLTGILIEEDSLLLVKQKLSEDRLWSLPGGRLEAGESIEEGIIREMKEETGLDVEVEELLYLCDKLDSLKALLHITFRLRRKSGEIRLPTNEFDENPISDVRFIKISELEDYGFSRKFIELISSDFPAKGGYMGDKSNIGL